MRTLETSIEIGAPVDRVWEVLAGFDSYPEWNPFVREISGTPAVGERLRAVLQPPQGRGLTIKPVVTAADPGQRLSWIGRLGVPGIFDGQHLFELTATEVGTRLVHSETFRGVLVPVLWRSFETGTRAGFELMNEALKNRVESMQ